MTDDLYRPQVSIAKIGKRYYWTVYRFTRNDEVNPIDPNFIDIRIFDGFEDNREAAAQAHAALDEAAPGSEPERYHGGVARRLYKLHHGKKRQAKHTNEQADLGYMYTWDIYEDWDGRVKDHWSKQNITKITKKCIFVHDEGRRQYRFDRAEVEKEGRAFFRGGTASRFFYSEAGKAAANASAKVNVRSGLGEHANLLGLGVEFTRANVMRAFREKAHEHHPDKGGDPAIFRRLIEARDRALRTAA
jgi:hypothetical protein